MTGSRRDYDSARGDIWRKRVAALGALLTPLILIGVGLLLVEQVSTANRLRKQEQAAQERRALILSVLSAHQDIETGSRGYVIAGQDRFLEPMRSGEQTLGETGPALRRAYAGNTQDLAVIDRISILSGQKRDFAATTVAIRRTGSEAAAAARVSTGHGKVLMDAIRMEIATLLGRERVRLADLTAESNDAITTLRAVTFGLMALLLGLLGAAWLALRRTIASRDRALVDLEDVSQRRKAILEGAMDGIVTINPSGSIESTNTAIERMFGYDGAELDRRDVGMLLASQPAIGETAETLRAMNLPDHGAGASHVIEVRRKDGSVFPAEVAISLARLTEGLRYVAVIRDVTERKRVERLKSEFVSTVSHELRTPLTSIAGSLGLLTASAASTMDKRSARLIEIAHGNANRLVRLINDILDIEKMESGRMPFYSVDVDLETALGGAVEAIGGYAQEYGVKLRIDLQAADTPALVSADRDRLAQVFDNLLSNAVKFSPRDGTVTIGLQPGQEWHLITVTDEGPGIPAEFHDRIFGKFAQADASDSRQKGGTGLGLSIVREIVRRLGGQIDFTTGVGVGTTFHVRLPALRRMPAAAPPAHPTLLVCGNGAATTFTEALRQAGYAVSLVKSVAETHEATAVHTFAGIIVDMGLADGAGIAIIRAIRESRGNARTPVLALGGRPGASELDGDAALVLDWLHKPGEVARLVDRIGAAGARSGDLPKVLHVEDDPDVVALVAAALEGHAEVIPAPSVAVARSELARQIFDLAVVDLTLADGSGIALLPELRRNSNGPIPVVIFSAQDADPETADLVDAYLTKARTPISTLVTIVGSLTSARTNPEPPE